MSRKDRYTPEEKRIADRFGFRELKDMFPLTWGDAVDKGAMNSAEAIQKVVDRHAKEEDRVMIWRTLFPDHKRKWFTLADPGIYDMNVPEHRLLMSYYRNAEKMFAEKGDLNVTAIKAIKAAGMKAFHWGDGLFDNMAPPSVLYRGLVPFAAQAKLQETNPGVCRVDRFGQPQYGVWEYRYPKARAATIGRLLEEISAYDFDGMMLSTRTHAVPATNGEQYGYNDVIDAELKKRRGVSFKEAAFWRDPNAMEERRKIVGESLTLFLRELRQVWPKDKALYIGVPRGRYFGPPYGNVFVDWRIWVEQKLVDGLYLSEVSGKALYYPTIMDDEYVHYLSDEEAGVGVNPYYYDLEHVYGPACAETGVDLRVNRDAKSVTREVYGGTYRPRLERGEVE